MSDQNAISNAVPTATDVRQALAGRELRVGDERLAVLILAPPQPRERRILRHVRG